MVLFWGNALNSDVISDCFCIVFFDNCSNDFSTNRYTLSKNFRETLSTKAQQCFIFHQRSRSFFFSFFFFLKFKSGVLWLIRSMVCLRIQKIFLSQNRDESVVDQSQIFFGNNWSQLGEKCVSDKLKHGIVLRESLKNHQFLDYS